MNRGIEAVRQALRILRTHPTTLQPVREALEKIGHVPGWREGGYTAWLARADVLTLQALNAPDERHPQMPSDHVRKLARKRGVNPMMHPNALWYDMRHFHAKINSRAQLKSYIDNHAVNGKIGLIESGRDCDCVEYVHPGGTIPATVAHYLIEERKRAEYADGPFVLTIVTPQQEKEQGYESRDLALEAYEDGHPHHIVSRFP